MMRTLLALLLGTLIGANVTYYLMTRDAPRSATSWPARPSAPSMPDAGPDAPVRASTAPSASPPGATAPAASTTAQPPAPTAQAPAAEVPDAAVAPQSASAIAAPSGLVIPVSSVRADQLQDTFTDARGAGRVHDAIDIMAATGTPVVAVADGSIEKLFTSAAGGLTIYQFEPSGRYAYYYAHLDRYAPGIVEKKTVRQGDVIGYVGSTGNADPAAPHLHFAIFALGAERQWWKGDAINPYPVLRAAR